MNISEANATHRVLEQLAFLPIEQARQIPDDTWEHAAFLAQRAEDRLQAGYIRDLIEKARARREPAA